MISSESQSNVVNVYAFISGLRNISFDEKYIFSPTDLIEMKDWIKVVYCIRMFAHFVRTKREDFDIQIDLVESTNVTSESVEGVDVYELESFGAVEEALNAEIIDLKKKQKVHTKPFLQKFKESLSHQTGQIASIGRNLFVFKSSKAKSNQVRDSSTTYLLFSFLLIILWLWLWWNNNVIYHVDN